MRKQLLLAVLLAAAALAQRAPEAVAVEQEPKHKTVLENEFVRVYRVEIPAGESALLHRHAQDYLWIVVRGSEMETTVQGGSPERQPLGDGEKGVSKAPIVHRVANVGSRPFLTVAIELKHGFNERAIRCGMGERPCASEVGDMTEPLYSISTLFETDRMKVSEIELDPKAVLPTHEHPLPHLVIAMMALELESSAEEQEPARITQKEADVAWVPAGGKHKLTNVGKSKAKFVTVEFR
jgi:quercetin dioxygenase-like cupin family protein